MRTIPRLTLLVMLPALLAAQALSRSDLLEALKSGRAADQLVADVSQRGASFYPNPEDEAALAAAGATPALLSTVKGNYRPAGPPITQGDLLLLLRLRPPRQRLERLIESRGVAFAVTPQVGGEILAAGGDSALVGLIALHQRAPAAQPPPTPAPPPATQPTPALAPNAIPFQKVPPYDPAAPAGACDLRVRVDQATEFLFRGSSVTFEVKQGADPVDAGSSCTQPLPQAAVSMGASKLRGRGKVTLIQRPVAANIYAAKILVEDEAGGSDLYHIRLTWTR